MIDIKSKKCEFEGCDTQCTYGRPGHQKSHCFQHREKGMIRRSNAKCKSEKCREMAIWGINWTPSHCEMHRTENELNLVEQPCSSCNLMYVLDAEKKCENCNPASFETARLAKQNALMAYLDFRGLPGNSTDITIDNGICGRERPDRVYELPGKIIVLECDEHQHRERNCVCEQTRMVNISQSFGGTPVYFIRWNPDDYAPADDRKNPEYITVRHKLCADVIESIFSGRLELPETGALVYSFHMYFDGWEGFDSEAWNTVL